MINEINYSSSPSGWSFCFWLQFFTEKDEPHRRNSAETKDLMRKKSWSWWLPALMLSTRIDLILDKFLMINLLRGLTSADYSSDVILVKRFAFLFCTRLFSHFQKNGREHLLDDDDVRHSIWRKHGNASSCFCSWQIKVNVISLTPSNTNHDVQVISLAGSNLVEPIWHGVHLSNRCVEQLTEVTGIVPLWGLVECKASSLHSSCGSTTCNTGAATDDLGAADRIRCIAVGPRGETTRLKTVVLKYFGCGCRNTSNRHVIQTKTTSVLLECKRDACAWRDSSEILSELSVWC